MWLPLIAPGLSPAASCLWLSHTSLPTAPNYAMLSCSWGCKRHPCLVFPFPLCSLVNSHSFCRLKRHSLWKPFWTSLGTVKDPSLDQHGSLFMSIDMNNTSHYFQFLVFIAVFFTRLWTPWEATGFDGKKPRLKPNRTFTWWKNFNKLPNLTGQQFLIYKTQLVCILQSYFMDQMR